jgi:hypothetical protein
MMVINYKKRTDEKGQMMNAVENIKIHNQTMRETAKLYNIPYSMQNTV